MDAAAWIALYAAGVATGVGVGGFVRYRREKARDERVEKLEYGTNLRIADFGVMTKGTTLLVLGARIVNDSRHDVMLRHADLAWGTDADWHFSDGPDWPRTLRLNLGRSWMRAGIDDPRDHGAALQQDDLLGTRRGVKTTVWAAKTYFLANEDSRVTLRLTTDDGTFVESAPLDWRAVMLGEPGWEHLSTPSELPPFIPDKI